MPTADVSLKTTSRHHRWLEKKREKMMRKMIHDGSTENATDPREKRKKKDYLADKIIFVGVYI